ncbi:MAG: patatin-like phospholipase family protein [Xanthomonadales bacterium]|nr:patatin-like phospholipase family protein [Xanthomonadales bacterium]
MITSDDSPPVHELGLVMAGAVSAGAYTAGVVDFLVEALDGWHEAQPDGPGTAPHRVRLASLTGASGGAMTAGILAGILAGRPHRPAHADDPGPAVPDNALFDSWVNRIDADALLAPDDLGSEQRLLSLLNGGSLDEIAAAALPAGAGGRPRAWAGAGVDLAFTITNLRGVPYNLGFGEAEAESLPRPGHGMRRHAEALRFRLGADSADPAGADTVLDWAMLGPGWTRLQQAALASGAFPLALPPRALVRPVVDYDNELWPFPAGPDEEPPACRRWHPLPPHWGAHAAPETLAFLAVDGGMLDNQPFTLGRGLLVGRPPVRPRTPVAGRSLVSIDPFPDIVGFRPGEPVPEGLLDLARALLVAMKNQTRFKPEELVTAQDDPMASRHMVAPSRRIDGVRADHPLAGGVLDGFGGFLDRSFRVHDFRLGRLNCQRFLERHLRLPGGDPLFARWPDALRARHADRRGRLPVLPLVGSAAQPLPMPAWPTIPGERMRHLRRLLRGRIHALLPHAIDHLLARSSAPMRLATRLMARWQSRGWVNALADHIERELRQRGQLG